MQMNAGRSERQFPPKLDTAANVDTTSATPISGSHFGG
jgi:hypothetical protein